MDKGVKQSDQSNRDLIKFFSVSQADWSEKRIYDDLKKSNFVPLLSPFFSFFFNNERSLSLSMSFHTYLALSKSCKSEWGQLPSFSIQDFPRMEENLHCSRGKQVVTTFSEKSAAYFTWFNLQYIPVSVWVLLKNYVGLSKATLFLSYKNTGWTNEGGRCYRMKSRLVVHQTIATQNKRKSLNNRECRAFYFFPSLCMHSQVKLSFSCTPHSPYVFKSGSFLSSPFSLPLKVQPSRPTLMQTVLGCSE